MRVEWMEAVGCEVVAENVRDGAVKMKEGDEARFIVEGDKKGGKSGLRENGGRKRQSASEMRGRIEEEQRKRRQVAEERMVKEECKMEEESR
ncbi:hypothetical protein Pmani_017770 [Petrolisthes manimaculis]|uniref:Uncharacterized protein n=1 Tax=Petrolisthes manimaculis TaxID=1843537 RepID=A0AAE1PP37_9EUCA|nr:hypothetical protein Pmani_017770 [Petrolisthes manimaculis]